MRAVTGHYELEAPIHAPAEAVFDFADDHARFSSHMSQSSWMMGGGKMEVEVDANKGRTVGSHIRLSGRVFGLALRVDEVVTDRRPPFRKVWKTVDTPRLLIIGGYRLGFEVMPNRDESRLMVFIDFEYPTGWTAWLGRLAGGWYARWCVRQMVDGVAAHFAAASPLARQPAA